MKLTSGITLFNKQSNKVNQFRKNEKNDKNSNYSIPIVDKSRSKSKSKEKTMIDYTTNNKNKEKVTLIKSFMNKNEKKSSKSRSNSSKEYQSHNLSSNKNCNSKKNLYPTFIDKKKYIFSNFVITPFLGIKIYETVISKIFEYIKNIVPKNKFFDIKKKFIIFVLDELHIKNKINFTQMTEDELYEINLKLFFNHQYSSSALNSNKKNKYNSKINSSFTRNTNNKSHNINNLNNLQSNNTLKYIYNTTKGSLTKQKQNLFYGSKKEMHSSLYSLNKCGAKINTKIPSANSASKSRSKSKTNKSTSKKKDSSQPKQKSNISIQNYKGNNLNSHFAPDMHLFQILNQNKSSNQNYYSNNSNSKNKRKHKIKNCKYSNNQIGEEKHRRGLNNIFEERKKNESNKKEISQKKNNEKGSSNGKNEKSIEQLKEIKSNLDDNLKKLFNFSYEGFYNKESESESKKSGSEVNIYNNIGIDLNENYYYRKKK